MSRILKLKGAKRALAAQLTIDESTGVAIAQGNEADQRTAFWYTGFGVFIFWNLFTLLGALGAKAIGDTSAWGLDVASPAIFCAVLYPRLKERSLLIAALLAFIWALSVTGFVPAGVPIISTVVIAAILGWK
jgi:predicted branched-subunit amino acid permease